MNTTSYDSEEFKKIMSNLTEEDLIFLTDIITLRKHLNKSQNTNFDLPTTAYVYILKFHPEVRNILLITSDLEKTWSKKN